MTQKMLSEKSLQKKKGFPSLINKSPPPLTSYDLQGLEVGALFEVPSGIDNAGGRLFRVISMQNIMVLILMLLQA